MGIKLYVGNLSYATTEEDIRALFAQAGTVESVTLIKDRFTGTSKGFSFVEMSSQAEAQNAINTYNNHALGDRNIKVSAARPREEGSGGGFRSGGGGGGGFGQNRGGPGRKGKNPNTNRRRF